MLRWSLRKRCLTTLAGFLVTLIPLLFPPGPLLVSEATTRIVGPVDESGKLRFRQYFNQDYDQVRPEDNGYELLADPLPVDQDTPWYLRPRNLNKTPKGFVLAWCNRVAYASPGYQHDQLPIPQLAPVNDLVRPYFEELLGKPWVDRKPGRFDHHLLAAQYGYAMEHPWTRNDFPVLANYIEFNKQVAMDALLQSAECPVYIPRLKKRDSQANTYSNYPATEDSLINQSENDEFRYRNLGLALQIHTTLMIGEGKTSSWLNQLGRLHASIRQQTRTDKRNPVYRVLNRRDKETDMLAAYATILRHAGTDPQICQQLTEILDALPPALTETEYVDQVLRYYVLDFIQETKQFGTAPFWRIAVDHEIMLDTPPLFLALGSMMVTFTNWDKETIHIHQWMDSLADTVREPDAETRRDAVQSWFAKMIRADMGLATRACLMTYLKIYLRGKYHQLELSLRDRMVLLRQQIAIERHCHRTGVYPNQLDQVEGISLSHGDTLPMSNNNLFFRGNETGYMLGLSSNDLWDNAFSQSLYLRPSLFHPQGHKVYRTHLSELHAGWFVRPFHVGGKAYELLRLSDEEVIAERERLQLDEDDIWIEERRQSAAINELQQAGARFFEGPWTYLVNESSTFTPILVWFSAAEENMFDDRLIPTLVNIMVDRPSIHIVNLNATQVTPDGLIQLLELIAAAEDTDRDKPVTIECAAINEQVIGRFKELQSSRIELQLPEGELLTTEKESLIDY